MGLVDPLSDRELEVLRLLGSDLDGPAIARQLVVSLNTVRTHTKHIYTKLGVNNRRAAISKAHQLDLLLWYMGDVAELSGMWANLNHPTIEVEDTALATIRFKSGALAQILVTNSVNPALYGRVQINGSTGASIGVQTDGGAMFIAGVSKIAEPPVNDVWTIPGEEHLKEQ